MDVYESVVIGAGQAGLSTSYHLRRLGIDHVVLDADEAPGGAWQHRWDSLTMHDVHGVADLPGSPAPERSDAPAKGVLPSWFAAYEAEHALPVVRPVRVDRVTSQGELLVVHAGPVHAGPIHAGPIHAGPIHSGPIHSGPGTWRTRTLVNATGTWTHPFVPHYPGIADFAGEQLHTIDYPGAAHFAGRRVLVVGGGASAVQFLGELAPVTETIWVTRREPVWRDSFDREDGRAAVALVEERVRRGLPPASVVSVTGLALREQEQEAERLGAYRRRPMFARIEPTGVRWADGTFEPVDAILWATGFRPAIGHLADLHLRSGQGGVMLDGTTAVADRRVQLVGYGPSASTIGANRAGRVAARAVARQLAARAA